MAFIAGYKIVCQDEGCDLLEYGDYPNCMIAVEAHLEFNEDHSIELTEHSVEVADTCTVRCETCEFLLENVDIEEASEFVKMHEQLEEFHEVTIAVMGIENKDEK